MSRKTKLILFIHGLFGGDNTWGNFENLLTKHEREIFEDYDVKFFEYNSGLLQNPKIQRIADDLRAHIENTYIQYNDITLVCHSMGGLVAKQYLTKEVKFYRPATLKVKKVIFYDTPHNGADLANWAKVIGQKQIAQLATDSDLIEFLNEDFYGLDIERHFCMKYVIAEKKYKGIRVVSRQSAQAVWANKNIVPLAQYNHIDCCKPSDDMNDLRYSILKNFVLKDCP